MWGRQGGGEPCKDGVEETESLGTDKGLKERCRNVRRGTEMG